MIQEKDKRAFQGMSDADFFKSPHLVRLLCAVLVNVTKKKMRVTIESHTKALAYTNGSNVTINPEHPLLRPFPREDRVAILIGLVGHEGAHICLSELPLYSDFRNALKKFRFLFGEPDVPGFYQPFLVEIQEYMDRESTALRNTMLSFTQDVFNTIEDGYIERWLYREYPGNIKRGLREINQAIYDSLEPVEKIERQHPIQAIQNGLLSYILLGTVKGKSALYPDLIRAMVEEMQKAFGFSTAKERMQLSLAFFVMCWPIIKPQIDKAEQEKENIAEGLTGPKVPAKSLMPDISGTELDDAEEDSADSGLDSLQSLRAVMGEIQVDISEQRIAGQIRRESASFPDPAGGRPEIHFAPISPEAEQTLKEIRKETAVWSRKLAAAATGILKRRDGANLTGLSCGRLGRDLYRIDGKVFSKKILPAAGADIAVGVLIDESGSMCYGEPSKSETALRMALLLYDFCHSLEIPCCIAGHSAESSDNIHMDISIYTDFEPSARDALRVASPVYKYQCNYDDFSLRYMGNRLLIRPENMKVLFVISDGAPSIPSHLGRTERYQAMRETVKKLRQQGIIILATTLDVEDGSVQEIYQKDCIDATDFKHLPARLPRLLSRYVS